MKVLRSSPQRHPEAAWLQERGFEPEQIAKLEELKRASTRDRDGFTPKERHRLEFARWLYRRGLLSV